MPPKIYRVVMGKQMPQNTGQKDRQDGRLENRQKGMYKMETGGLRGLTRGYTEWSWANKLPPQKRHAKERQDGRQEDI
jgi:hypothetical protein